MPKMLVVVIAGMLLTVAPISRAASQTSNTDVSSALLGEVRLLRATIERIVSVGASGQLILGRLQLQEQRVNAVAERLERTRAELAETRERQQEVEESVARYTAMLADGPARPRQSHEPNFEQMQSMLDDFKSAMGDLAESTRRLTAEEAAIASQLAAEQAVWADLSRRLDEAERMLARKL